MRVSRKQAQRNREQVVETASALFRRHGFDGVGIAALMKASGLTHGGFYGNFSSKEDLFREAVQSAVRENSNRWANVMYKEPDHPLEAIAKFYLGPAHGESLEKGCALAALAGDAARKGDDVRRVFDMGIEDHVSTIAACLDGAEEEKRSRALAVLSLLVGGLVLARATADKELTAELAQAAVAAVDKM